MSTRQFNDYSYALKAGIRKRIPVSGNYFALVSATVPLLMSFDGRSELKRARPCGFPIGEYTYVELMVEADDYVTVSLGWVDDGVPYDTSNLLGAGEIAVAATLVGANSTPATSDKIIPAGGKELIAIANPKRNELRVTIPPTAVGTAETGACLRLGDFEVDALNGGNFFPGEIAYLETQAETWAFNLSDAPIRVSVMELNRV